MMPRVNGNETILMATRRAMATTRRAIATTTRVMATTTAREMATTTRAMTTMTRESVPPNVGLEKLNPYIEESIESHGFSVELSRVLSPLGENQGKQRRRWQR